MDFFDDTTSCIQLNGDWQRELNATRDDIFFRVHGQSMDGAHIPDGSLILVEPLPRHRPPREGQPAVVQVVDEEGMYHVTLKHWHMKGGQPYLRNGAGEEVEFGFEPRAILPFGVVKRAIIEF